MTTTEILHVAIDNLEVTDNFKRHSSAMGFKTIQDVLNTLPVNLIAQKGFNYVWFGELLDILEEHGLSDLIQPKQGNSRI